jgi:hypothetical protein
LDCLKMTSFMKRKILNLSNLLGLLCLSLLLVGINPSPVVFRKM